MTTFFICVRFRKFVNVFLGAAAFRKTCCFPKDTAALRKTQLLSKRCSCFTKDAFLSKRCSCFPKDAFLSKRCSCFPKDALLSQSPPYNTNLFSSVFTPFMLLSFSKALSLFCSTDLEKSTIKFSDSFNASFTCSDKTTTSLIPWSMEAV